MKFRKLRIAWSVGCGIICLLLIVLWVRSYWRTTYIVTSLAQISLMPGTFGVMANGAEFSAVPAGTVIHVNSEEWMKYFDTQRIAGASPMGNHWSRVWGAFYFHNGKNVPFWFLVAIFAALSAASWRRWRFTLRALLIATTLVAVVLGLIVWLR